MNDPRYFQIFYLGSFLFYGISSLQWHINLSFYLLVFATALSTQLVCAHFTTKRYSSIKSALITALGLCLLLKTNVAWIGGLAAFVAIASKYLIKNNNKHIFNPANVGIIAAIVFTGNAWINPGQWGSTTLFWFFIGAAGLMMILKVGRLDTTMAFLISFGGLMFFRQVVYLGWEPAVWLHKMSNGTLLLFAFFMITDPMTTPNHKTARLIWSAIIGIAAFVAASYFYSQTAAIWILFIISPLTPVFDRWFIDSKFEWSLAFKKNYQSTH